MRKHWIMFVAKPKGTVTVDDGARKVLLKGNASLLLPGVAGCEGSFSNGDVVLVVDSRGMELGRGITNYAVTEMAALTDRKDKREFIHLDDLVLTGRV